MTTTRPFNSYILCATPRSGSTLLCEMLAASGVAGRPNSFFRVEDLRDWADAWGVPRAADLDGSDFDRAYLAGMIGEGTAGTGIFGLRIMWDSMAEAHLRLNRALGRDQDLASQFAEAFGPPLYVHLSRRDKIAQSVSRVRAEQSGVWHKAADGRILESTGPAQPFRYDRTRIAELVSELEHDDAAWTAFFRERRIEPLNLVYEDVSEDPRRALGLLLSVLGLDVRVAERTPIRTAKLGDETSTLWAHRFRLDESV